MSCHMSCHLSTQKGCGGAQDLLGLDLAVESHAAKVLVVLHELEAVGGVTPVLLGDVTGGGVAVGAGLSALEGDDETNTLLAGHAGHLTGSLLADGHPGGDRNAGGGEEGSGKLHCD